jgi:rfaE bifunctional protein kinase chain/domain
MNSTRLNMLLAAFATKRIAVLGDYFLDRYLDYDSELAEVSLETGKTANQVVAVRHSPGAAGTVVCNLAALGAGQIICIGFRGDDGEGYELGQDLTRLGCMTEHLLVVPERYTPVYCKPRDIRIPGLDGEAERYDTKNRLPLPQWAEEQLMTSLESVMGAVDAVIVMDQVEEEDCGVVTYGMARKLTELAREHPQVVFWADSRRRTGCLSGVITKANQYEAVSAAFPEHIGALDDDIVVRAGWELSSRAGKPVFLTRGEQGMLVFDGESCHAVRGVRVSGDIDPTGAGDSATAAAVLTLVSGGTVAEAALVANLVASITVRKIGTTGTAKPSEMLPALDLWHSQA